MISPILAMIPAEHTGPISGKDIMKTSYDIIKMVSQAKFKIIGGGPNGQ